MMVQHVYLVKHNPIDYTMKFILIVFLIYCFYIAITPNANADYPTVIRMQDNQTVIFYTDPNVNNPINDELIKKISSNDKKWSEGDIINTSGIIVGLFGLGFFTVTKFTSNSKVNEQNSKRVIKHDET
jgi:hypothetical protein